MSRREPARTLAKSTRWNWPRVTPWRHIYPGGPRESRAKFLRPPQQSAVSRRVPKWDFGNCMLTRKTRKAPAYLRAATRRWWEDVVSTWELQEHHIRLLTVAAESWDRVQGATEAIKRDGLTTPTRHGGQKLHPACRVEVAAQTR